jgi:hypothetical protein
LNFFWKHLFWITYDIYRVTNFILFLLMNEFIITKFEIVSPYAHLFCIVNISCHKTKIFPIWNVYIVLILFSFIQK